MPSIRYLLILAVALLVGCDSQSADQSGKNKKQTVTAPKIDESKAKKKELPKLDVNPRFTNVARAVGVDFTFFSDAVPERYFLPEIMGGGVAWFDYDLDGWLDLYVMNGCHLKDPDPEQTDHINQLYHNQGKSVFDAGRNEDSQTQFTEVTESCGVVNNRYGQGVAAGDFDADGFPDLYLTNYGANALLHNNGDGTFTDVTEQSGVGSEHWGTGAIWFDVDNDGDLDLYVVNYLDVTFENLKVCKFSGVPGYCGPGDYTGVKDQVYLNQGDGTFVESGESLGIALPNGKGLAVAVLDFNDDLKPEIYVANDMHANFLFTQQKAEGGALQYADVAEAAGCSISKVGHVEASMGISCGDFNGDSLVDMFLTHFYMHKNTLYLNRGDMLFDDDSYRSRIAATSFETLGFGTVPFDFDEDGALDIFITNGHVLGPRHSPNVMLPQLLRNDGTGRFADVATVAESSSRSKYFSDKWLGRGAAGADYDNDGDLDLTVTHLNRPLGLLRNDTDTKRHFLGLNLQTPTRIPPVGGRVEIEVDGEKQMRPIIAGGSYLCSSDARVLFGVKQAGKAKVTVYWTSGRKDVFEDIELDRYYRIMEGREPEP